VYKRQMQAMATGAAADGAVTDEDPAGSAT
jgi:hypothetical protein